MNKKLIGPVVAVAIIGSSGLALIKNSEGLRTKTYLDPVGIPTVCYGHTGKDVRLNVTFTPDQCNTILLNDISAHLAGIKACGPFVLNQNQQDAVVSFTFNVGVRKFCRSTMAKKLRAGDYQGAANEFPKWKYGTLNGELLVLPGLSRRRTAERDLFLTPLPLSPPMAPHGALRAILKDGI